MWKKFRNKDTLPSPIIRVGAPQSVDSTYDPGQLERAENLNSQLYHSYEYNPNIPSNTSRDIDHAPARLPTMQFSRPPPTNNDSHNNHYSVAASSVYSQPSPDFRNDEYRTSAVTSSYYGEVSPPSSPTRSFNNDHGGVSPVEESFADIPPRKQTSRQGSQIPVPRKMAPDPNGTSRNITPAKAWTKDVGKKPMQWDDYSGEPTFDGEGKPGQVKPGEFNLRAGLKPVARKVSLPVPEIDQDPKAGHQDKASRFVAKGTSILSVDTNARPAWKGASGRQALVPAPRDNPGLQAPKPQRTLKQTDEPPIRSPVRSPQTLPPRPLERSVAPACETTPVASPPVIQEHDGGSLHDAASIKPTPPLKLNQNRGKANVSSPETSGFERTGYPSPVSPNEQATTPTQATHTRDYRTSPIVPTSEEINLPKRGAQPQTAYASPSAARSSGQCQDRDPVTSRFSWTTTNTSTTYQQSPPPSPPAPMSTTYGNIRSPPSPAGSHVTARVDPSVAPSILSRGHPTRRLGDQAADGPPSPPFSGRSFSITSRKPIPVPSYNVSEPIRQEIPLGDWREGSTFRFPQRAASLAPSTATSLNNKSLPKTPGELSSADLITTLQAQQNDLQRQRFNIQRIISDLEKPGQQNPLYTDFRARRENDRKCEGLKADLSEVIAQEHDVGLRLHRAWKRREKEDPNAPQSILWVRRATSGV
ncbi:hypothetical protein E2P81_ATG02227 [Venturia nashicola]|uniref:Uncharacterized protein n=1 Tax=Venturia nashicola TaxID=86259 RepID=A0A4Z1PDM3_9PEZI|nr:hypothetical protein E6O75_ATG02285 [Venturia nashicola]TLD35924.1 hypothetical protein E2P81_ATG02227 [Venturia nashicola]